MSLLFDHLVVKVNNLNEAIQSYSNAGFTVAKGGTHKYGLSENALIFLKDGSFIELLALKKGLRPFLLRVYAKTRAFMALKYSRKWGLFHRFYDRALSLPDGTIDFCLLSSDIHADLKRIDGQGLFVTKPMAASRKRPDGSRVNWLMASTLLTELPFLRSAYQPPFVATEDLVNHANGVTGVKSLTLLALDFKEMVRNLGHVLNQEPKYKTASEDKEASFSMATTTLVVKKSSEHDDLVKKYRARGLGVYAVEWEFGTDGAAGKYDFTKLNGLVSE